MWCTEIASLFLFFTCVIFKIWKGLTVLLSTPRAKLVQHCANWIDNSKHRIKSDNLGFYICIYLFKTKNVSWTDNRVFTYFYSDKTDNKCCFSATLNFQRKTPPIGEKTIFEGEGERFRAIKRASLRFIVQHCVCDGHLSACSLLWLHFI